MESCDPQASNYVAFERSLYNYFLGGTAKNSSLPLQSIALSTGTCGLESAAPE